jgi:hypothetical protein
MHIPRLHLTIRYSSEASLRRRPGLALDIREWDIVFSFFSSFSFIFYFSCPSVYTLGVEGTLGER